MADDRTVHIELPDGREVVRYDRAGKWYIEGPNITRLQLDLFHAAAQAIRPGARVFTGRPGGRAFDAAVRRLTTNLGHDHA